MPINVGVDLVKDITDVQQMILDKNPRRLYALLANNGANPIYLSRGIPAVENRGIPLIVQGSSYEINATNPWHGSIHAVCPAGLTSSLLIQEN